MAVVGKKVDYNDYKERAHSKLSKQEYITKPENRQLGTKVNSAEKATAILKKAF